MRPLLRQRITITYIDDSTRQTRILSLLNRLEAWVGVDEQLLEVGLEPSSSLGGRLEGIAVSAVGVVARRGGVRGTVTLTTGLDPDESVLKSITSVGGEGGTEASANDVAPVTPGLLLSGLNTVTGWKRKGKVLENQDCVSSGASHREQRCWSPYGDLLTGVHDEVGVEAVRAEERSEGVDVALLVTVLVTLSVRWAGGDGPGVVVGNVGGQSTDGGGRAGILVHTGEEVGSGSNVGGPSKPASVSYVKLVQTAHMGKRRRPCK